MGIQKNREIIKTKKNKEGNHTNKTSKKNLNILISAGGTGGHIHPGIAIADDLKNTFSDANILFVSDRKTIAGNIFDKYEYNVKTISIKEFKRSISIELLLFPIFLIIGTIESLLILLNFKPNIVIGTGGYVSGPILLIASLLGIPTLIQEQNSIPGRTTKALARFVKKICLSYEKSIDYIKYKDKVVITGNPIISKSREGSKSSAIKRFNLQADYKTVFITGGSQGAYSICEIVAKVLQLMEKSPLIKGGTGGGIQFIIQTGEKGYNLVKESASKVSYPVFVEKFIDYMGDAYAVSDLVVCRAGAITLSEITYWKLPSITIPYPFSADNHQIFNAQTLVDANAGIMIQQKDLTPQILLENIESILSDEVRRETMAKNSGNLAKINANEDIIKIIKSLVV